MHNNHRILATAVLAAILASTGAAQAQDSTFKLGAIRYDTTSKTNGVTGIGIPAGADATTGDATTLLLTYEYALSPNFGVELVLGVPPKIKATATGSVAFLGEVLSARNVAPTILFNYHFFAPGSTIRPYVGVGINYTRFTDVKTPYGWDVNLSDSTGLAAQVGVDWQINKQWGLFASYGRAQVKTDLTAVGATVLRTTIDFRPQTYSFGASFRF
jgi:outer membrane protein